MKWAGYRHDSLDGWFSVTHPGVRQHPAGLVAYPFSSIRRNSPSGAPAYLQGRDLLEFVAGHQALTLLPLASCRSTVSVPDDVEHLLTRYFSMNFLFHRSVHLFNVILIFSCRQQHSVPMLLDTGVARWCAGRSLVERLASHAQWTQDGNQCASALQAVMVGEGSGAIRSS